MHKRYCTGTPPEEPSQIQKCQHCKFLTNFETALSAHFS